MSAIPDESMLDHLRDLLTSRDDVGVALVFGSRARRTARPDSDLDLAVEARGADLLELGAELSIASDSQWMSSL